MIRLSKPIKVGISLIVVIAAISATIVLYNYYNSVKVDLSKTKDVIDIVKDIATVIALGVGAIWAYFNFFKGRTYRPRLEPKVTGKLIKKNGASYLAVTAQLKNVGLSDVKINQEGSALRIFAYSITENLPEAQSVEQSRLITLSVFEDHGWIEPGELIEDQRLIAIPNIEYPAIQIKLRLVSYGIEWNSAAIIESPLLESVASNQIQLTERAVPLPTTISPHMLEEHKRVTSEIVNPLPNIANINMQKKEDTEKSRRIEEEKKSTEVTSVEQSSSERSQS